MDENNLYINTHNEELLNSLLAGGEVFFQMQLSIKTTA
tara:strand:- start:855 stop:968 length:114 start_codon:yes stop_codon:yes gene_type:complete